MMIILLFVALKGEDGGSAPETPAPEESSMPEIGIQTETETGDGPEDRIRQSVEDGMYDGSLAEEQVSPEVTFYKAGDELRLI